MQKNNLNPRLW